MMIYLLLSILASTAVLVIFRMMDRSYADTRHTILVSYMVSTLPGILIFSPPLKTAVAPWFFPAVIEGVAFYAIFRAMAKTAQTNGIAVASIAAKMSVVIPVLIGLLWIGEKTNWVIIAGVLVGLISVVLSAGSGEKIGDWKWPILVFFGTGLIDASFKLFQIWGLSEDEFPGFVTTIFAFAFVVALIHHLMQREWKVGIHSIGTGVVLGLANFGTVYFILKALAVPDWESSVVFPLNNFGIVTLSTVVAITLFNEKLRRRGWFGLAFAGLSIVLLYIGSVR